ncbi:dysbindin-like isoform X1 [Sinocyclocheilus anshuiensis]|uniref:dysbindin-like isoform X1 n=1 Tax=Sinocyclocheilus anshuiensis TaxID=1608454 RepID=UPI0007B98926|nr:PREDICTED: dysbindin-like isoform X1 [Sinocyclocheilus anshuiensis]
MSSPGSASGSKRNSSEMEHAQRVPEVEPVQPQIKLKDRQKFFEEAFQQDMEHYLSTGYLQIAERRGSMSSMEVNVDMLEQMDLMDLMDMSDHEALDVFLNSGGEDNSVASPLLGPDVESFTSEITLQVPTQADLRHKLASLSSTCTDSASQDTEAGEEEDDDDDADDERGPAAIRGSPHVQPDQEEVEADATLPEREQNQPMKNCESSSSS